MKRLSKQEREEVQRHEELLHKKYRWWVTDDHGRPVPDTTDRVRSPKQMRAWKQWHWANHEAGRKWREAEIARLEKSGEIRTMANEEIEAHLELWVPPMTPAETFIMKQPKGTSLDDIMASLVAEGIPLDRRMRGHVTGWIRHLRLPEKQRKQRERQAKKQSTIYLAMELKRYLVEDQGMTPGKADDEVAENLGMSNAAVDKMLKRARQDGLI